jgi:hypothetical protein
MVKLDAMENPHRLPPELQAELGRRLGVLAPGRFSIEGVRQWTLPELARLTAFTRALAREHRGDAPPR